MLVIPLDARIFELNVSTVLAQDHFYSDFLSLSLTILTHKGSVMINLICRAKECALTCVTGGMNLYTADNLNGSNNAARVALVVGRWATAQTNCMPEVKHTCRRCIKYRILAEGAIALSVTLSGGALFAS